jgi:hypothetical protein
MTDDHDSSSLGSDGKIPWGWHLTRIDFVSIARILPEPLDHKPRPHVSIRCRKSRLVTSCYDCWMTPTASRNMFESQSYFYLKIRTHFDANDYEYAFREAGAVILKIAYGYTTESHKRDPLVHLAGEAMDQFGRAGVPGAWMVDIIPACSCHIRFDSVWKILTSAYSETSARLVPWYGIQAHCSNLGRHIG